MGYKHYLITRFNLSLKFDCPKRDNTFVEKQWLNYDYLINRFFIFEKYTIPSVESQTVKNFQWIVLFHKDTPEVFKQKIEEKSDIFTPLFLDDLESLNFVDVIDQFIMHDCTEEYVITSRVDNDDALSLDYIETIQNYIASENLTNSIISMEHGLQYNLKLNLSFNLYYKYNHFLSQIVPTASMNKSIYHYNHAFIYQYAVDIRYITKSNSKRPYWVEIIHETNYSNSLQLLPSSLITDYNLKNLFLHINWSRKEFLLDIVKSAVLIIYEDVTMLSRRIFKKR